MPRSADAIAGLIYSLLAIGAAAAFDRLGLFDPPTAWMFGALLVLIAGQAHGAVTRAYERQKLAMALQSLRNGQAALAGEIQALEGRLDRAAAAAEASAAAPAPGAPNSLSDPERLAALIAAIQGAGPRRRDAPSRPDPLYGERPMEPAGEAALDPGPTPSEADAQVPFDLSELIESAPAPRRRERRRTTGAAFIDSALHADRIDLHLQPIVSLPQRRPVFYEGFARLRDEAGRVVMPAAFLPEAEAGGLIADLDVRFLEKCGRILRALSAADRRVGVFCNLSLATLSGEDSSAQLLDLARRHGDLAASLIFELTAEGFAARSGATARTLARLADYGFRFSLDNTPGLNLDLNELQRAGVRFIKPDVRALLAAGRGETSVAGRSPGAVAGEDIIALFARYGVDVIAAKIERESEVVEALDLDLAYGQGHLFGAPRPVRQDALSAPAEPQRQSV